MDDKINIRIRDPRIERLHLVDLAIAVLDGESLDDALWNLTLGLLVRHETLIDASSSGGHPVVRFTGPRSQLEELLHRYDGVPGAFPPAPYNPDPPADPARSPVITGT